jgi:pantothenate kinase
MRSVVDALARRALSLSAPPGQRCLVGVAGCPGGGKTTTVSAVVHAVNKLAGEEVAAVLPMDGFHYTKQQLDAMADPALAHARRGAPWTFDAAAFVTAVRRARCTPDAVLRAPSFDHAAGDPVPDGVTLEAKHRLVLVEGNYIYLDTPPWCDLLPLFHDRWFVTTEPEAAIGRIVRRHMAVWGSSRESATKRAASNDSPNARLVWATRQRAAPDVWVPVLEDAAFAAAQQ